MICFAMNWNTFNTETNVFDFELHFAAPKQIPFTTSAEQYESGEYAADYDW